MRFFRARRGLKAIPKDLPSGQSPELRLLPGLYTGDNNVFFGGPADSELPDFIRYGDRTLELSSFTSTEDVMGCQHSLIALGRNRAQH